MKESIIWSAIWLACGLSFTVFVFYSYQHHWLGLGLETPSYAGGSIVLGEVTGATAAIQYLTGYIVEKSLAMDNIFVIAMIFGYFAIPGKYQHRVLFWGIIGALIMRGGMIYLGAELIMRYTWILIVFGIFLILTAVKMALIQSHSDPGKNPVVRLAKRFFRTVDFYDGQKFFTRRTVAPAYAEDPKTGRSVQAPAEPGTLSARWAITPLFLALIMAFSGIATLLILPALVRVFEKQLFPATATGRLVCNCTTCTIVGATLVLTVVANFYQMVRLGWTTWTWASAVAIIVLAVLCRLASRRAACAAPESPAPAIDGH